MRKIYLLATGTFLFSLAQAQTTVTIVADKDNTIYSAFPDKSNGAGQYFFAGRNGELSATSVQRALLHFDVSSIPAGSLITSATLTVYITRSAAQSTGVNLHKVTSDWGEGTSNALLNEGSGADATPNDAAWVQRFYPSTPWTIPGGDFSATISSNVASVPSNISTATAITFSGSNVQADIQSWITNPAANFGWIIKADEEITLSTVKRFISRNSAATAQYPSLSVTYAPGAPVPVNLTHFSASLKENDAILQWVTAGESRNKFFDIQHSTDGINFVSIGRVEGHGTSAKEHSYIFTYANISEGRHFYRLVQYDVDGAKRNSKIITLASGSPAKLLVHPNPALSFISVTSSSILQGAYFTISSFGGQVVKKGIMDDQQINVRDLPSGQYWLTVNNKGKIFKAGFFRR